MGDGEGEGGNLCFNVFKGGVLGFLDIDLSGIEDRRSLLLSLKDDILRLFGGLIFGRLDNFLGFLFGLEED